MKSPSQILEEYWGFTSFRPGQEEIISSILNGKDTIALLPTGGGKSICFQVPALIHDGICIVVSPLVALMTNQVEALKNKGIKALSIIGGISSEELTSLLDNAIFGNYKFLYLSPERLQQEQVQSAIKKMNINLIAVDEAHCISQWGNDFRPSYKNIHVLKALHPMVPTIALTATATPEVLEDTILQLKLELPQVVKNSFVRPNLAYKVLKEDDKIYRVEQLLKENKGSAIVYVRSRNSAAEIHNRLESLGFSSTFYHGGISSDLKKKRLEDWLSGRTSVMVATNAFGMGIDNPSVRYVIHVQLPDSLESYFQEAGRAGRDGDLATAVIIYNDYDKELVKKQFVDSLPTVKGLKLIYRKLNSYFQISYGEGEFTQHSFNFNDFCKTYDLNTLLTFNGLNSLDRLGVIQLSKEFGRKSVIQFLVSSEILLKYFETDTLSSVVGKTILRVYGGIFDAPTKINLDLISSKTGQKVDDIIEVLKKMEQREFLSLKLFTTDASLTFLKPREDEKTINPLAKEIENLNDKKASQVASVLGYVKNDSACRSRQLVAYFGELNSKVCGICSVCASSVSVANKEEKKLISEKILIMLEEREMNSREISEKLTFNEAKILHVLQLLMDAEKINVNSKNEYGLS